MPNAHQGGQNPPCEPAAAARALLKHSTLSARDVCEEALKVAAGIDLYSNEHLTVLEVTA